MKPVVAITALTLAACVAGETASEFPEVTVDAPAPVIRSHPRAVKIDYMLRGYFYAGAAKSEGLGGNGTSENMPRPIAEIHDVLTAKDGLHVLALVDDARTFAGKHDGFRVIVANASSRPLSFDAQDSRLDIVHEAIDPSGAWAPIEYLPSSWCGNSYHSLELPPRSYWELTAPHYDGDYATRLRIRVAYRVGDDKRVTYSDELPGRIHRAQFTVKQGHSPASIMDPYSE